MASSMEIRMQKPYLDLIPTNSLWKLMNSQGVEIFIMITQCKGNEFFDH